MNRFKMFGALILALLLVAAPCVPVLADDDNLGGVVTYNPDGLTSLSFDVKSKSPKGHARPEVDIGYYIEYDGIVAGPIVSFAKGPSVTVTEEETAYGTNYSVHYEANSGETTITSVPLRINVNGAVAGLYSYHISQLISEEQKADGFSSIDFLDMREDVCTQYELYLVVGNNGKVTQAVLKKNGKDSDKVTGFVVYYENPAATDSIFSVELHKRSDTGVEGIFDFDVKIDLPTGSDPSVLNISVGGTPIDSSSFVSLKYNNNCERCGRKLCGNHRSAGWRQGLRPGA